MSAAENSSDARTHGEEVRDVVIKSSLSGVAVAVLTVAAWSPMGLGSMIGTSIASDSAGGAEDVTGLLAPYPSPVTEQERAEITTRLAESADALDRARTETDEAIAHVRLLATSDPAVVVAEFAPVAEPGALLASADLGLREEASEEGEAADVQVADRQAFGDSGFASFDRDPHLEFAKLLFAL